jgi:hypothetical protein
MVSLLAGVLSFGAPAVRAQDPTNANIEPPAQSGGCLPDGTGYLRARIDGAIKAELDWRNADTECTGAVRPTDGGVRMRFTAALPSGEALVVVFGIATMREGSAGKNLPVNLTIIREGAGEFYGTQGDDKCMLDEVEQVPLVGIPHRSRSYRVIGRGYCTEPARAIRGQGALLMSRFDFAGRVDFDDADGGDEPQVAER